MVVTELVEMLDHRAGKKFGTKGEIVTQDLNLTELKFLLNEDPWQNKAICNEKDSGDGSICWRAF